MIMGKYSLMLMRMKHINESKEIFMVDIRSSTHRDQHVETREVAIKEGEALDST